MVFYLSLHEIHHQIFSTFQTEQMRDLERELEYMREESNNIQSIKDSLPNFCPKNGDRCLENDC